MKRSLVFSVEESIELNRLLLNGIFVRLPLVRVNGHPSAATWDTVSIDDLIDLMTELVENCMEDNKQEAYKGIRMILRGLKRKD